MSRRCGVVKTYNILPELSSVATMEKSKEHRFPEGEGKMDGGLGKRRFLESQNSSCTISA
jgi:hypothetical protein